MAAAVAPSTTHSEARDAARQYLNSRLAGGAGAKPTRPFEVREINIERSFSSNLEDRKAVAAEIHEACTNSGFFYITGHGVSEKARNGIMNAAKRFAKELPESKKQEMHARLSPLFRGWEPGNMSYVNPEDRKDNAPETKSCFNFGYEEGLDPTGGDGKFIELNGQTVNGNVWPAEEDLPGFYEQVKEYYSAVLQLARHLFRLFALSLDLEENFFDSMTTHPGGISRLLYYPPTDKEPQPFDPNEKVKDLGLGAHSDYECFTILHCSTVKGLEILSPENYWVPAKPVENSFVINVGDFLMRWTNDVYKSTIHRVVNRIKDERYSVPLFVSINYDQQIETLPSCITKENPAKYPPVKAGQYILERVIGTF